MRSHALHLSKTENPQCRAIYATIDGYLPGADDSDSDSSLHGDPDDGDSPPRIFEGDLFGNASQYHEEDFPGLWSDGDYPDPTREADSDTTEDEEEDASWEPPITPAPAAQLDRDIEMLEEYERLLTPQERQNAEQNLRAQHFVDHFPSSRAGEAIRNTTSAGYSEYYQELQVDEEVDDNPYHPFASKMDWEIAKWAKLRGPSSTATTELLGIEGVRDHGFSLTLVSNRCYLDARNSWPLVQECKRAQQPR